MLVIRPNFTSNFAASFGANSGAAQAAWLAAAHVFASHFADNVHVNITVDAVPGTDVFGESVASWIATTYAALRGSIVADAKTPNDQQAVASNGSFTATDPTNGAGNWLVTRAQAKALGIIKDDVLNDGTTTFGAGNPFTFAGPVSAGTYDFQGIAAHEISEVLGRVGLAGYQNTYSLIDNLSYTAPNSKGLTGGPGNFFSLDAGRTSIKLWNDPTQNGLDARDWASGTDDAFNQFSDPGVCNAVSAIDLQLMDAIGYDLVQTATAQSPNTRAFGVGVSRPSALV